MINEQVSWKVLKTFFERKGFVSHQTESFDWCINEGFEIIVKNAEIYHEKNGSIYSVSFSNVYIPQACMVDDSHNIYNIFPAEARQRNLTYESPIYIDIKQFCQEKDEEPEITIKKRVFVGRMPIMLRSSRCNLYDLSEEGRVRAGECRYDPGGYFIIKGNERVLISQIRASYNTCIVNKKKPKKTKKVDITQPEKYIAEVRSISEETGHSILLKATLEADERTVSFSFPYLKEPIPAGIIFKALNISYDEIDRIVNPYQDEDIQKYVSILKIDCVGSREDALLYIGKQSLRSIKMKDRVKYAKQVIENDILPHTGTTSTLKEKAYFLGSVLRKYFLTVVGKRKEDDKDNYKDKRIECAGILCADLFRTLFKRFTNSVCLQLTKKKGTPDIVNLIAPHNTKIFTAMKASFANGKWGFQKNSYIKEGVSQVLNRLSYTGTVSHLRRLSLSVGDKGKNSKIRQINPSQCMTVCCSECFDPKTPILMWDSSIKLAEDIKVGDLLVDDLGNPTRVKSTVSGESQMFEITQKNGMSYTVTDNHILTLKIKKYKLTSFVKSRQRFQVSWFDKSNYKRKTRDFETKEEAKIFFESIDDDNTVDIPLKNYLDLSKFQKSLLHGYKFSKTKKLKTYPITVTKAKVGQFVGWQLDGNQRFLLGDLTVSHNSPEGAMVGIVMNFALSTVISRRTPIVYMKEVVKDTEGLLSIEEYEETSIEGVIVLVNKIVVGITKNVSEFIENLKDRKKFGLIPYDVSISYDPVDKEINIYCDDGRMLHPVYTLNSKGEPKMKLGDERFTFDELLQKGKIAFIDTTEQIFSSTAFYPSELYKYGGVEDPRKSKLWNYLEISPALMLGLMGLMIPYSDRTQSPRNCYSASMCKQAIGLHCTNYQSRTDTVVNVLHYQQRPLVATKALKLLNVHKLASGVNTIVAIASFLLNQEDSVILNKGAIDRGLFHSTTYRTISDEEKKVCTYNIEKFEMPPLDKRNKFSNYNMLDEDGIVKKGTKLEKGDVVIAKTLISRLKDGTEEREDCSVTVKKSEEGGIVDKIYRYTKPDGYSLIKIRIRIQRIPEIGDKFACYSPDTEVLTDNGWKWITDVLYTDKLACLVNGKELEYHNPTDVQAYDYKGDMYSVETKKVSLLVTPNHRMYTGSVHRKTYRVQRADEIYGKARSYLNNVEEWKGDRKVGETDTFTIPGVEGLPDLIVNMKDWCVFFGIWIAEGSCTICYNKTGGLRSRCLNLAANKPRVQKALEKCTTRMGFERIEREENGDLLDSVSRGTSNPRPRWNMHMSRGEMVNWFSSDARLIEYFKPISVGATNKRLPDWCFSVNKMYARKLIKGMVKGDGHYMKGTTTERYDTSSIGLRDDFQRLCLHAGWSATFFLKGEKGSVHTMKNGNNIVHTADAWRLTICKTQTHPLVNKYLTSKGQQQDKWVPYDNWVYCCTVPTKEGLIYTRRNGLVVWSGNSRNGQKGTVGMIFNQEDMPFTLDGITPDIIMNSHALPSRMTINQPLESAEAEACLHEGVWGDATPFKEGNSDLAEKICARLKTDGLDSYGMKTMMNGMSGEMFEARIFMGPTYYVRIKHLVAEKIHARARGQVTTLTRQPLDGIISDLLVSMSLIEVKNKNDYYIIVFINIITTTVL